MQDFNLIPTAELEELYNVLSESELKGELDDNEYSNFKKIRNILSSRIEKEKNRKMTAPKQVVVVRKDLKMPSGKFGAQVSHAAMGSVFSIFKKSIDEANLYMSIVTSLESPLAIWLQERFTKIILAVYSEQELLEVYEKANNAKLPCSLIKDAGFTVFGEPTYTCVGIGPCLPEELVGITDKLKVY